MPEEQSLLELLACPKCHGKLARIGSSAPPPALRGGGSAPPPALRGGGSAEQETQGFACERCALFYAVDDGLPNMLIEDASPWPPAGSAEKGKPGGHA